MSKQIQKYSQEKSKQIQKFSLEKSKQVQKSLRKCVSKIKVPKKPTLFRFHSCKHIKTASFSSSDHEEEEEEEIDRFSVNNEEHKDNAATLSAVDQFLFENFRSLFEDELSKKYGDNNNNKRDSSTNFLYDQSSARLLDPPPPLPESLCRRARFFVSTDSSSSLFMERTSSVSAAYDSSEAGELDETAAAEDNSPAPDDFITLLTYSPSPYEDFRRSMLEMVKVRREHNGKVDWQFMEELLFCYLDLNNKKSYRYILRAFVDLAGVLRENSSGRISSNRHQQWKVAAGGKRQLRGEM